MSKVLIVRTDRVGDVLLTTPVMKALKEKDSQTKVSWLVRRYTAPLLEGNPDVDQILTDEDGSVGALVDRLKQGKFDAAIVALPRFRISWALWRAKIPVRIGPASKWYSLFFTHRIWQHRSKGAKHEADYNIDLLSPLGVPFSRHPMQFVLSDDEKAVAKKVLESHRINLDRPIVFLHPGSGGSSARWPLAHFMRLGDSLQEEGFQVVVTGGPGENYQNIMIDQMRRIPVFVAAGSVSLRELAALYSWGDLLVANSTGPLHLAVALGVPTVSIYSPIPTCHPKRWGPYPAYVNQSPEHQVFIGEAMSPEGESREDLSAVSVPSVQEACRRLIKQRRR